MTIEEETPCEPRRLSDQQWFGQASRQDPSRIFVSIGLTTEDDSVAPLLVEEATRVLDLTPTMSFTKGELRNPKSKKPLTKTSYYSFSRWNYEVMRHTQSLEEVANLLLETLKGKESQILALIRKHRLYSGILIACYADLNAIPNIDLSPEFIAFAHDSELEIGFDLYISGEQKGGPYVDYDGDTLPHTRISIVLTGASFQPEEITQALGIAPTQSRVTGEATSNETEENKGEAWLPDEGSYWAYTVREKSHGVEELTNRLLDQFGEKEEKILELCPTHKLEAQFIVSIDYKENFQPWISFDKKAIAFVRALNIGIDISLKVEELPESAYTYD